LDPAQHAAEYRAVPGRAGQPGAVLAAELIVTGAGIGSFKLVIDHRSVRAEHETPVAWLVSRIFPAVVSCGSRA
jgi:hypothetical protein